MPKGVDDQRGANGKSLKTSTTVEPFSARHVASGIDQVEITARNCRPGCSASPTRSGRRRRSVGLAGSRVGHEERVAGKAVSPEILSSQ